MSKKGRPGLVRGNPKIPRIFQSCPEREKWNPPGEKKHERKQGNVRRVFRCFKERRKRTGKMGGVGGAWSGP